jgi:TonB family protein
MSQQPRRTQVFLYLGSAVLILAILALGIVLVRNPGKSGDDVSIEMLERLMPDSEVRMVAVEGGERVIAADAGAGPAVLDGGIMPLAEVKQLPEPLGDYNHIVDYPSEAKKKGVEGIVIVRLVVEPDGSVSDVRLVRGLGFGLDEMALELAKKMRFKPGQDASGHPVRTYVPWTFKYRIPR